MNNIPPVTKNLLIINAIMFLATQVFAMKGIYLENILGLHYIFADGSFNVIQLVTYMFMHADFSHLFFNMFALWMFGRILEFNFGSQRFLVYYLVCGIGAGLIQELVQFFQYGTGEHVLFLERLNTIGASGAVFGILLGFGMLFPEEKMFIFPLPVPIKAKYFVIGYAVIELSMGVSSNADGIAHFAHLGGMLFGYILIKYWRNKSNGYYN